MWSIGASWRQGASVMMMSVATFYRLSCIEVWQQGRGCLELGCKAGFRDLFAQCEEKGPKSMFCLGVFRERMSENSTMDHKRDIINTEWDGKSKTDRRVLAHISWAQLEDKISLEKYVFTRIKQNKWNPYLIFKNLINNNKAERDSSVKGEIKKEAFQD